MAVSLFEHPQISNDSGLHPEYEKIDMKLNKALTLVALVAGSIFAGGAMARAQDSTTTPSTNAPAANGGMHPHGTTYIDRLVKALSLTDEQKTNVQTASVDRQKQMNEVRSDSSLSPADKRAKYKQLQDDFNTKLKGILTPAQYDKWSKIMSSHRHPTPHAPAEGAATTNSPSAQ